MDKLTVKTLLEAYPIQESIIKYLTIDDTVELFSVVFRDLSLLNKKYTDPLYLNYDIIINKNCNSDIPQLLPFTNTTKNINTILDIKNDIDDWMDSITLVLTVMSAHNAAYSIKYICPNCDVELIGRVYEKTSNIPSFFLVDKRFVYWKLRCKVYDTKFIILIDKIDVYSNYNKVDNDKLHTIINYFIQLITETNLIFNFSTLIRTLTNKYRVILNSNNDYIIVM